MTSNIKGTPPVTKQFLHFFEKYTYFLYKNNFIKTRGSFFLKI